MGCSLACVFVNRLGGIEHGVGRNGIAIGAESLEAVPGEFVLDLQVANLCRQRSISCCRTVPRDRFNLISPMDQRVHNGHGQPIDPLRLIGHSLLLVADAIINEVCL
jgi:hypothetical protein